MERKYIFVIIIVFFAFILSSCSQNWEYLFQGKSENWIAELKIRPYTFGDDLSVGYFIYLEKVTGKEVKNVHYELNTNDISFFEVFIKPEITLDNKTQVGGTSPSTMKEAESFHKGMSIEDLESVLRKVEFTIKWEDNDGNHEEVIILKPVE